MPDKHAEYLAAFLESKNEGYKDMILESLLDESEECALIEFYDFRRDFELYRREHCPGTDSFCGIVKRSQLDDLCVCCREEMEEEIIISPKIT